MNRAWLFGLILLWVCGAAQGYEDITGFRSAKFGMTKQQVIATTSGLTRDSSICELAATLRGFHCETLSGETNIGELPFRTTYRFQSSVDDRLAGIDLTLNVPGTDAIFDSLIGAIEEKFGTASRSQGDNRALEEECTRGRRNFDNGERMAPMEFLKYFDWQTATVETASGRVDVQRYRLAICDDAPESIRQRAIRRAVADLTIEITYVHKPRVGAEDL